MKSLPRLFPFTRRSSRGSGFALVIVLCAVVLITILVLAFFSRAALTRQISFSSTNQIKSDMLARSALDIVTGEIRQEIADYSTVTNLAPGASLYQPLASTNMVPAKMGVNNADATLGAYTMAKLAAANTRIDPGTNGLVLGSSVSIDTKSRNGRSSSKWFDTGPQLGTASLPTWVYLSRGNGIITNFTSGATSPTNANYVIGRFTYAVYNTGGLLDANVSGYPASIAATNYSGKSSEAYADLTALGLSTSQVDGLVSWRNAASGTSTATFNEWATGLATGTNAIDKAALAAADDGYLSATAGDNAFLSRRDLIRYLSTKGATNAAGSLTHFTRASTAPSWGPSNVTGSSIAYGDKANDVSSANRLFPRVLAFNGVITDYADDGTSEAVSVSASDPLVRHRFSLAKLAWIGHDGPNVAAFSPTLNATQRETAILTNFGLKWNSAKKRWDYDHSDANNILTLDEVRQLKRAPDFFELLKAGILSGSLGGTPGQVIGNPRLDGGVPGVAGDIDAYSVEKDRHVLQIGANIIDQADADNYPTAIYQLKISGYPEDDLYNCVFGVENLPSLSKLGIISVYWPDHSTTTPPGPDDMKVFIQPELWNPHDSSTADPANYPKTPTKLRFVIFGACSLTLQETIGASQVNSDGTPAVMSFGSDPTNPSKIGMISFKNPSPSSTTPPSFFDRPVALTTALTGATTAVQDYLDPSGDTGPDNRYKFGATKAQWDLSVGKNPFLGVYLGKVSINPPADTSFIIRVIPDLASGGYLTFVLQYQDANGDWFPYTVMSRIEGFFRQGFSNTPYGQAIPSSVVGHTDPRTDRFSVSASRIGAGNNNGWDWNKSARSTPAPDIQSDSDGRSAISTAWPKATNFSYAPTGGNYLFDAWSQNLSSSDARYSDPDGVTRRGDSWRAAFGTTANGVTDTSGDGMLLYHFHDKNGAPVLSNSASRRRPVILNRPFRSVAELGYVFRDQPWKTLDLWSSSSADVGLLDLFCVSSSQSGLAAGQLNPNGANPRVIQAMLQGAGKQASDSTKLIASDEAAAASTAMATQILTSPLANPADFVANTADPVYNALTGLSANNQPIQQPYRNKTYGETPIRALSSTSSLRTWNLLIDITAQTGRLAANATGLQDFIVEGERRYWLHLAIDRLTGKIVDSQYEPVYE